MIEYGIEGEVSAYAAATGWMHRLMQYRGRRGCPDHWYFGFGKVVIIEFKRKGKDADPLQAEEHKEFAKRGIKIYLIDNIPTGKKLLDDLRRSK